MYWQGEGIAPDPELALVDMKKSASAGNPDAMRGLGMMYQTGTGTLPDSIEADHWFLSAVAHGNDTARANSNVLQKNMTLADIQEAQRRAAGGAYSVADASSVDSRTKIPSGVESPRNTKIDDDRN